MPKLARGVKPGINRNEVYALRILLPPLTEQRQIVAILNEAMEDMEQVRAYFEANLADLDNLRQSILQRAFTGELT